jgi:hypothetical protein
MYPCRDRGRPSWLMDTGKQAEGSAHRPGGLWPCSLTDPGKQPQGTTLSRVADTHEPSWSRGNDEKGATIGDKGCGHWVPSIPASEGKAHPFADRARPCALIDVPIRGKAAGIHDEGLVPRVRRRCHRRESRTPSPRCATRFARRASGSAVKGRPLSGEGDGLPAQRPGACASGFDRRQPKVTSSRRVTRWDRSRRLLPDVGISRRWRFTWWREALEQPGSRPLGPRIARSRSIPQPSRNAHSLR